MTQSDAVLRDLARAHGVHTGFHDLHGHHHEASPDTLRALLGAVGVEATTDRLVVAQWALHQAEADARILPLELIVMAGDPCQVPFKTPCDWTLTTEEGDVVAQGRAEAQAALPGLVSGYYVLSVTGDQSARVLVRPARAPDVTVQLAREHGWGLTGALYGLRSAQNGGLGNYKDLAIACRAFGQAGAAFFGINPVHALGYAAGDMISPYSPTHRGFFNIDHIATNDGLGPTPDAALVDYAAFRRIHRAALEAEYQSFEGSADFEAWRVAYGDGLINFSVFEALSERHGADARRWPTDLQRPGAAATRAAGERAAYHAWLQWRAETQVAEAQAKARQAGMPLGLYLDLAVGARPGGAETWMNTDTIARGVTIGAPPDHLSPAGQSWALAAHAPGPLSKRFYKPLRAMLRKLMTRCGLLRIDHALGLLRSFWIPEDGSPGGYISQPLDAFLALIAIEAERTGCVIIGEDLGLVPQGFREKLNEAGLYSYSVWQYETDQHGHIAPPETLRPDSLACFSTHDTPTLRGFWYGDDVAWWQGIGWIHDDGASARHAERSRLRHGLRTLCDMGPMATPQAVSQAIQSRLAQAPSALMAIQLDDAFGSVDAQNLPGTIDEHPNWRRRLSEPVEDFAKNDAIQDVDRYMPPNRRAKRDRMS